MDRVRLEVNTDKLLYTPGEWVTGTAKLTSSYPVTADRIVATLSGVANVWFQEYDKSETYANEKVLISESQELWRFVRLAELLDLPVEDDYTFTGFSEGVSRFPFKFRLPSNCATSFSFANCPANVKYSIKVDLLLYGDVHYTTEHVLPVVVPNKVPRAIANKKVQHSKIFTFPKNRVVIVDCSLEKGVFTPVEKVPIELKIINRWKQSIKYAHVNVVRRVEYSGILENYPEVTMKNVSSFNCTGVGLPSTTPKIAVGETFTFRPDINLPALTPNMMIENLMKLDYFIKISIGRAHNFVIAEMMIPITIVTDIVDDEIYEERTKSIEENLIDFGSASPCFRANQFVDLLA